ncbi:acyl carrier protein [Streptomyces lunalinharesii]|uniref:Phosphopantetheine-binding protein n=1 Tax=Streptomyces lunalinharesii TaxID=333384 RepID=A0ABN3RPW3_9ACTN
MDPVYDHLVTVLTDKFEVDGKEIRPDITLGALELDSLAVVELYVTLQEHWGVPLDEDGATAELTLDQVAQAVSAQLTVEGAADRGGAPQ